MQTSPTFVWSHFSVWIICVTLTWLMHNKSLLLDKNKYADTKCSLKIWGFRKTSHLFRLFSDDEKTKLRCRCCFLRYVLFFWFGSALYVCVASLCVCVCMCVHLCNQEYITELQALLCSVSETDFKLNSPEYWPAAYYNMSQQEHCLKVSVAFELVSEAQCDQIY